MIFIEDIFPVTRTLNELDRHPDSEQVYLNQFYDDTYNQFGLTRCTREGTLERLLDFTSLDQQVTTQE